MDFQQFDDGVLLWHDKVRDSSGVTKISILPRDGLR